MLEDNLLGAIPLGHTVVNRMPRLSERLRSIWSGFPDSALETEYQKDRQEAAKLPIRWFAGVGIFFMFIFLWQDKVISPE